MATTKTRSVSSCVKIKKGVGSCTEVAKQQPCKSVVAQESNVNPTRETQERQAQLNMVEIC